MKIYMYIAIPTIMAMLLMGCATTTQVVNPIGNPSIHTTKTMTTTFFQNISGSKTEIVLHPDSQVTQMFPNTAPPKTNVVVNLPMYPGAVKTSTVSGIADTGTSLDADLLDGEVYFRSKDTETQIKAWYSKELRKIGYTQNSEGSVQNHGKTTSSYYGFSKSSSPDVSLGFLSQRRGGETLFKLKASYIVVPNRPMDSYLPRDIVKVILTEGEKSKTITGHAWISKVVTQINSLQMSTPGITSGGGVSSGVPTSIKGMFYEKSGATIPVVFSVISPSVTVGKEKVMLDSSSVPALTKEIDAAIHLAK